MFNKDHWNEILEALSTNKTRTIFTAFGVFWGIAILVLLLALTNGLRTGVMANFGNFATNSMFMWSRSTSKPYKGLPKSRSFNYKINDVDAIKLEVPNLKYVSPRNQLGGYHGTNNVIRGAKTGAFQINGDYPEFIKQKPMDITLGRFINYSDINAKRKVCVIGLDVVKGLYDKNEKIIGSYIKINGVNFMVIGTFKTPNSESDVEEEANTIIVPFTSFNQAFNYGDTVSWFIITADDTMPITALKERIFTLLRKRHTIHPQDERAIGYFDLSEQFAKITGLFNTLAKFGYFVGTLILLSGMIGISNIMLILVKERTKEIGVRRALGATPWTIKVHILQESLVLTVLAGMLGISFAALIVWAINMILDTIGPIENFANPSVSLQVIFIALLTLVISGLLAGLIPANKATKIKPVDALRA